MNKNIIVNFDITGERHSIELEIPEIDITLTEMLPPLYAMFNKIIELETGELIKRITCHKGCAHCCIQMIPLSFPEVFYIKNLLNTLSAEKQKYYNNKFSLIETYLTNCGLLDNLEYPDKKKDIDIEYFKHSLECPFLENNACSIYNERPFVCREYNVLSHEDLCRDPYTNKIKEFKIKRNLGPIITLLASKLYSTKPVPIPLTYALIWSKKNRYEDLKKFPGTWLFTKIMNFLMHLNDNKMKISY